MRTERVASLIAREISLILSQEIRDPRLGMVTITKVTISPDLKEAKIYFTTLGNSANDLNILERAKGYIRTTLAQRIRIKFIPDLKFVVDDSSKYGEKIDKLLEEIEKSNKSQK
ncbi:MAG: 30S ribosome-binding factor RbfA [candidate division WOR-3 bacterium]